MRYPVSLREPTVLENHGNQGEKQDIFPGMAKSGKLILGGKIREKSGNFIGGLFDNMYHLAVTQIQ